MTPTWLARFNQNERLVQRAFAASFGVLFLYALADWLRLVPGAPGFQPQRFVILTGAMLLQPIAMLLRTRSQLLFFALEATSVALLAVTIFVAS